jgi:hypothetical protein
MTSSASSIRPDGGAGVSVNRCTKLQDEGIGGVRRGERETGSLERLENPRRVVERWPNQWSVKVAGEPHLGVRGSRVRGSGIRDRSLPRRSAQA